MGSDFGEVSSFAADLRHSSAKVRSKAQEELKRSGKRLEELASAAAPVLTGKLRASVSGQVSAYRATVSATDEAAPFQEFGTSRHGPQPYMGPAMDEVEPEFLDRVGKAMEGMLDG